MSRFGDRPPTPKQNTDHRRLRIVLKTSVVAMWLFGSYCGFALAQHGYTIRGTTSTPVVSSSRSSQWPAVRKAFIAEHPFCLACGTKATVVHHIIPFHVRNDLELSEENLLPFCDRCHLLIGHLNNFRSWNTDAFADAVALRVKIATRPVWTNNTEVLNERSETDPGHR